MKLGESKHVHWLLRAWWPVMGRCSGFRCSPWAAGGPRAQSLEQWIHCPRERCRRELWHWQCQAGSAPSPLACWVLGVQGVGGRCPPTPNCVLGAHIVGGSHPDSWAWRFLPLWCVPGVVTTSEIVSVGNSNVHKVKTILRVEIRASLCSWFRFCECLSADNYFLFAWNYC